MKFISMLAVTAATAFADCLKVADLKFPEF